MARIIVVSTDVAGYQAFTIYVDSLRKRRLLKRIFVNKYYTIIIDVGYQTKLKGFKGLC